MQVIALSSLSHTNILPSSSSCVLLRKLTTDRSDNGFEDGREKGKLRGVNSVKKIFPGLKRDKVDDKSNNEKN